MKVGQYNYVTVKARRIPEEVLRLDACVCFTFYVEVLWVPLPPLYFSQSLSGTQVRTHAHTYTHTHAHTHTHTHAHS